MGRNELGEDDEVADATGAVVERLFKIDSERAELCVGCANRLVLSAAMDKPDAAERARVQAEARAPGSSMKTGSTAP